MYVILLSLTCKRWSEVVHPSSMDRTEALTTHFYSWELLGRGWLLHNDIIDVEPAFVPFFGHHLPESTAPDYRKREDEGRTQGLLGWMGKQLSQLLTHPKKEAAIPTFDYQTEPYPSPDYSPMVELSVRLPRNWTGVGMYEFLSSLATSSIPVALDIIATGSDVYLHLTTGGVQAQWLYHQLYILFPSIEITDAHPPLYSLFNPDLIDIWVCDYGLQQEFMRPISQMPSSLAPLIAALESVDKGELAVYQIMIQGVQNSWHPNIMRAVTDGNGSSFFSDAPEMVGLARDKVSNPLCAVTIRTLVQTKEAWRTELLDTGIMKGVLAASRSPTNMLVPLTGDNDSYPTHVHAIDFLYRRSRRYGMILNTKELMSLVDFPSIGRGKMASGRRTTVSAPSELVGHGQVIGTNIHLGVETEVSLPPEQRLRHTHIIGATGVGKSTLLLQMMKTDMESGNGITLLDPHGDVADMLLKLVPRERIQDVILLDPSDVERPVGINLLNADTEAQKMVLSGDLTAIFRRMSTSWGDSMDAILGNAVNVFLEHPDGGTLLDLRRFLTDAPFRKKVLTGVTDGYVRHFWEKEFPMMRKNATAPLLTRLDIFLRPKVIRGIMGHTGGVDFADVLENKKILIVKLAQGLIGQSNAYLLGTLITAKLYQAAQGRQVLAKESRHPHYLYIDEFQNFITLSMEQILSGSRKYGLGMILAHQDLQQILGVDRSIGNSILSNAGTRICFRVGEQDAQKLEKGFAHFETNDFQDLGIGEALVRVGRSAHDCNIITHPLDKLAHDAESRVKEVKEYSRMTYGQIPYVWETDNESKALPKERLMEIKPKPVVPRPSKEEKAIVPSIQEVPQSLNEIKEAAEAFRKTERKKRKQREHTRTQDIIRRAAQDYGFSATVEEGTTNPKGRVDVGIHTQKLDIACEVSVTNTPEYELKNIRKCLANGYDLIFMCSNDAKHLEAIRQYCITRLPLADYPNVVFGDVDEVVALLHELSLEEKPKPKSVKGYRVKLSYESVSDKEAKMRRKNIIRTIT